jgi:hypothetical protein
MKSGASGGLVVLVSAYLLGVVAFLVAGQPPVVAVFLGGAYALSALSAVLFSRGVLEFFIGVDREIAFFVVMRRITDPLLALFAAVTPPFLLSFAAAFYVAFLLYVLKVFLFGDAFLGLPPLFILLWLIVASG